MAQLTREVLIATKGGFFMNKEALDLYAAEAGLQSVENASIDRACPILLALFRRLGNSKFASYCHKSAMQIIEIPTDMEWEVVHDATDPSEFVQEKGQRWYGKPEPDDVTTSTKTKGIALNRAYGGFKLSDETVRMYKGLSDGEILDANGSLIPNYRLSFDIPRDDPLLLRVIDFIGTKRASAPNTSIEVVQIPADIHHDGWCIQEYDGFEWVSEVHRIWP